MQDSLTSLPEGAMNKQLRGLVSEYIVKAVDDQKALYKKHGHTAFDLDTADYLDDRLESILAQERGRAKLEVIEVFKAWADKTEVTYNEMMKQQLEALKALERSNHG